MSIITSIYTKFKSDILSKATNVGSGGDTINCILMNASGTFTESHQTYGSISANELGTANGYTAAGTAMTMGALSVSGTTVKVIGPATTQWVSTGAGFTAYNAAVYSTTNSNHLICHLNFGTAYTASGGGTFTITWDATNGIFNLA